jgi:hypothetical protein
MFAVGIILTLIIAMVYPVFAIFLSNILNALIGFKNNSSTAR